MCVCVFVCVTQVVALSASRPRPLGCCGIWVLCVSLCSVQRLLQKEVVLLNEAKKAAAEWKTGTLMPKPLFLIEACARSQAS